MVDRNATPVLCGYILVSASTTSLPFDLTNDHQRRYVAMHAMQEGEAGSSHDAINANGYAESPNMGPRKQTRPQMRDTIATVVGMLLPLLLQFGHHH